MEDGRRQFVLAFGTTSLNTFRTIGSRVSSIEHIVRICCLDLETFQHLYTFGWTSYKIPIHRTAAAMLNI